jgi:hypothetical protein
MRRETDMRTAWRTARAAGLVIALAGCGHEVVAGQHACTLMGGSSGVGLATSSLASQPGRRDRVVACLDGRCDDSRQDPLLTALLTDGHAFVQDDQLTASGPVSFTLRISRANGTILFSGRTRVLLHRIDINGAGCGPIVWQAGTLTASGRHTLTLTASPEPAG